MINSLSLPGYQLVDSDEQNEDIHFRLEAPTPVACEGCGVQGEFVRFGKRDVPYRDLPIHGKRENQLFSELALKQLHYSD